MKNRYFAALLSIAMPGLGQLFNRQFSKAIIVLILEHIINKLSNINTALMLCLNGHHLAALESVNFDFALFYPGFYTFSVYDAVLSAEKNPNKNSAVWFFLSGLSSCLGIIYSHFIPIPLFTIGLLMIILMLIGTYNCSTK